MASSSVAAILIGGGVPAWATCTQVGAGGYNNPGATTVAGLCVSNTNVTGSIDNSGTISPSGIKFSNGTMTGQILSSGTINGGISLDSASKISGTNTDISVIGPTFTGGISNAAALSSAFYGIFVGGNAAIDALVNGGLVSITISTFSGGISNSGSIATGDNGILVGGNASTGSGDDTGNASITISTFAGGISNSGTISSTGGGGVGVWVGGNAMIGSEASRNATSVRVANFSGGIFNSGTISAAGTGILVGGEARIGTATTKNTASVAISTFSGGIGNSGILSAAGDGIWVGGHASLDAASPTDTASVTIATFTGGVANSGTISAGGTGILVGGTANIGNGAARGVNAASVTISTFSGGISNSGTIDAGGAGIWVGGTTTNAAGGPNVTASLTIATFSGGIGNSGTIDAGTTGIRVDHVLAFSGGIGNAGSITASHYGIVVFDISQFGGSAGGGITNSGTISVASVDGIFVGGSLSATGITTFAGGITNSGAITANFNAIQLDFVSTFTGGITNSGTISAGAGTAISVQNVSTFSGGIANSATISAGGIGIEINDVAQFGSTSAGGISNSGTILAGASGIVVESVANFSDGISNFGTIVAALNGIFVGSDTTFAGGISNSGAIRAAGTGNGINVNNDTYFTGGISNSGAISVGGVGIYVTDVSTFSGNLSNSGKITAATGINIFNGVNFSAGAAVVNSGVITGTGGTAINVASAAGAVTVDQNAGTITGAIKLISTDDTLNVSGGTINGNIVGRGIGGGGTINFTLGAGNAFTYAAAYGFSGFDQVNIESGTVVLNGVNSAANVAVGSSLGGALAGAGTIDPLAVTINAGGTLAPGVPGGYGTLNITGNLAFASGSYYAIDIAPGAGNNSKVALIGAATLGGNGTVEVAPQLGHYAAGTVYQILTTTSALTGTFAGLTVNGDHTFAASLDYATNAPDDVDLDITTSGYSLLTAPAGLNQNQQNVLNGINNAILQGDSIPTGFFNLGGLSGAALGNALTQLEGQPATGAQTSAFQLMTDFMNLLSDPSSGGGGSPTGGGAPGFAPEQEASLPADIAEAYAAILKKAPPQQQQNFDQRWSAWGSAFGGAAKLDGNPVVGSGDVTASDYGFAAGMDYRSTPDSVYGFALAGGGTNWSVAGNLGSGRSDSFQAGVHDTTHWGPFYLSGALAFANHWFTTNRIAVGDQLTAKFDGQSYAARGEAGYRYAVPVTGQIIGVTPYAALQVQDFHTPGFSETDLSGGGLGLSFAAQNATDTRSELGARFDNVQIVNAMPLVLRGRLAWAHDWISSSSLGAVFQALPGSNFTVNGAAPPTNSALTSASAELHLTTNWTAIAKFDGEFAPTAQTYAGTGTLKYSW